MSAAPDNLDEIWKEYEKQLKAQREYEKNSIEIHPNPEFVLKTKLIAPIMAEDGTVSVPPNTKLFINFCSSEHIPLPSLDKDPHSGQDRLRVPLSCGELGPTTDNKGEHSLVVDVVVSPASIKLCSGNVTLTALTDEEMELISAIGVGSLAEFRDFCAYTALQKLRERYKLQIDEAFAFLKNLRFKGDGKPRPQRIRRTQPLPPKSVLETLTDVQDEEEDDAYVRPATKKKTATSISATNNTNNTSSRSTSSAKVELVDDAPVRRLQYRFACVHEDEEVSLAKYLQMHVNINDGKGVPLNGLPMHPSHFLVRVLEVEGVKKDDILVKTNKNGIFLDFSKYNDRIARENNTSGRQEKSAKSRPIAYENMRFSLPFSIFPSHVSVLITPSTHTLTVTAPVRGWSDVWISVHNRIRGESEGEEEGDKGKKMEVLELYEKMCKCEEEMQGYYNWKNAWKEKEKFGKKLLFRDSEEQKFPEEDEESQFVDVCSILQLENPFLHAVYM